MYIITSSILFIALSITIVSADNNVGQIKITSNNNLTEQNRDSPTHSQENNIAKSCNVKLRKITGKIFSLQHDDISTTRISLMKTRIIVNYGQYIAYPNEDGSFEVDNLQPDSYVIEVTHPKYVYEPARVDVTTKGSIRARKVNYMRPTTVNTIEYPLRFRPISLHNYFMPRETWRIMDLLFNPMVIMMVVPLVIIWVLPKMMSPQEVQTQRDNVQMPEYNVPELSEMMANMFNRPGEASGQQSITSSGGGGSKHSKTKRR